MSRTWLKELFCAKLKLSPKEFEKLGSFQLDSRQVQENDVYVAIKGQKVDGHQFLKEVQAKKALLALVSEDFEEEMSGLKCIKVPSVLDFIQQLAKEVIQIWQPLIVAITGSIGKTSAKEFLGALLEPYLSVYKTPGNFNTQLTLPLTILNAFEKTPNLILEMGIDAPGQLKKLIDIAPPSYALLTHLAHVHVENYESFSALADEKMKIFDHPNTQKGFYHLEMPFSDRMQKKKGLEKVSCSIENNKAQYYLRLQDNQLELFYLKKLKFKAPYPLKDPKSVLNICYAIAIAHQIGLSFEQIEKAIAKITYPKKRMVLKTHKKITFLNDAYNACLESVENALVCLPKAKRKVAILGGMVEQGSYSQENHQKVALAALKHVDVLIGYGQEMDQMVPLWKKSGKKWAYFLDYESLKRYVCSFLKEGDAVLVKASRKYELERLIDDFMAH